MENSVNPILKTTGLALAAFLALAPASQAADFGIDPAHSSVEFRVQHLGFSWLSGRFDTLSGGFSFDAASPAAASVKVEIDTASVNTNHAERDKHLKSGDFLNVEANPKAMFESTGIEVTGERTATIKGNLTLNGVTKEVAITAEYVGGGDDPWGGHRQGFHGTTKIALADFGIVYDLGPASREVELTLNVEGIRK
jgi:polyisoprenoid-binding protein YceI